ncbi:unnamed protein product, partial [Cylicostephanus goldi]
MSLILLRRLLQNQWDEFKEGLGDNSEAFFQQLLHGFANETDFGFRKKMLMVIAEVARNTIGIKQTSNEDTGKQKWLGIIQLLKHCMGSDKSEDLLCVALVLESVPNVFGSDSDQYIGDIKKCFSVLFKDSNSTVRSDALRCFVTYVIENDDDERLIKEMSPLMHQVVEVRFFLHPLCYIISLIKVCRYTCVNEDGGDDAPLQCLAELESVAPKLVNPHMAEILEMCVGVSHSGFTLQNIHVSAQTMNTIQCVLNTEKDEAFRHSATEVLATICECSTAVLKKRHAATIPFICKLLGSRFDYRTTPLRFAIKAVLLLMTHLTTELDEWLEVDDIDAEDDEESVAVGESALDRISCAVNGKALLGPFLSLTDKMRHSEDWRERHVALMGFSVIGEGCQRTMEPHIQDYLREIVPFLNDKHPRVRYAACNAIGQMSSDFAPTLQKKCHEMVSFRYKCVLIFPPVFDSDVVPALMNTMMDASCDRVSAHAAAALINFCEDCPKQIISAYLPAIMTGLEQSLGVAFQRLQNAGKKLCCEQITTAIASVADAAQDLFIDFYDRLVPQLKFILVNSTGDDYK